MSLDASGADCVIAILDTEKQQFFEKRSDRHNSHVESLFSVLQVILEDCGITYSEITHIAPIVGPGSFTGLRASLAAAQGFQLTTNISVHGVNLLELQAYLISQSVDKLDGDIMSIIPIPNRDLVYYQIFDNSVFPITNVAATQRDGLPKTGCYITAEQCNVPSWSNARAASEYLIYKLAHKLPETPLYPIYSGCYVNIPKQFGNKMS